MKKLFLVLVCSAALVSAKAQVEFGVKGGMNVSTVGGEDSDGLRGKPGFHLGGLVRIPITQQFKIQPELVFSTQGAITENTYEGERIRYNFNYLNIPAMFQYHTDFGLYGETGPQLGFMLSAKTKHDGDSHDIKDSRNVLDFSWGFGAGYHFTPQFGVNGRFNLGLSRLDDGGDARAYNRVLQAGVFYIFNAK
ncbi:porin family protein [Flavihumibacter solisilvae]|jgi:hypothetical protein|uniref:porin family protein n=1 Tax=Flavihumibacter solisilvae TaxID=1349421 RepID=UPI000907CBA4|nr:porin family protein [Flavihumibacter solisilvae]